jgi:hypothetical protein
MFRTLPTEHRPYKAPAILPGLKPQALPYPAKLIARRYNVHPRLAGVVAELVGYAVAEAEARDR